MCTVTFIPRREGYSLAMNRDERIVRGEALPPAVFEHGKVSAICAIYPRDIEGGTWIGGSAHGVSFALLNWNGPGLMHRKTRSRGSLIPTLISADSSQDVHVTLSQMDLQGILPFRLVGVFPTEEGVWEWRWDQSSLECERLPWSPRQWCSSSLSDSKASLIRRTAFDQFMHEVDVGSVAWMRRLHASHDPGHGPFSVCVHRGDVKTVSYTEMICTPTQVRCNYFPGSPCRSDQLEHSVSTCRTFASTVRSPQASTAVNSLGAVVNHGESDGKSTFCFCSRSRPINNVSLVGK